MWVLLDALLAMIIAHPHYGFTKSQISITTHIHTLIFFSYRSRALVVVNLLPLEPPLVLLNQFRVARRGAMGLYFRWEFIFVVDITCVCSSLVALDITCVCRL